MPVDIRWNTPLGKSGEQAVIYARYSSHSQGEQSIEGQLSEAHKYAAVKGYTIVHEYVDRAQSGRTDNRVEFQRMLRDTAKKQFTVIILWKVDRFGRNREEIALNKHKCKKNGVRVEYVAETIPNTPEGVILESVLEGFAEYYSLQLSQNIRRGIAESAEKCQSTGGNRPLGYKTGPDKKFVIDENTAPTVRMIFTMYADGATVPEIVAKLNDLGLRTLRGNPFTKNSLHTILKNEKYIGIYNSNGKHTVGGVPRIIDDDLFYRVQDMLKINKRAPAKTWAKADYILTDKLFCGKCGAPMFGESGTSMTGAKHNYYICSNKKRFRSCDKKAIRKADIEALVIKEARNLLADTELLNRIVENTWQYYIAQDNSQEELRNLRRQLEQTETAIQNLVRAIEAGIFNGATKKRMDELEQQRQDLKSSIADREIVNGFHLEKKHIAFFLYNLRNLDFEKMESQKRLIDTFVNSVFVFEDGTIKLVFNFSGENNTVTLSDLKAAERGEAFGRYASCSTTKKKGICRMSFSFWLAPQRFSRCRREHILYKNSVALRRIVDQNVRHRADELPVLQDRTAAHPLHNAARRGKQIGIRHLYQQVAVVRIVRRKRRDANIERFNLRAAHIGQNCRFARVDAFAVCDGHRRSLRRGHGAENTLRRVFLDRTRRRTPVYNAL